MSTGEELYVLEDNKFICKDDYISGKNGQGMFCDIFVDFDVTLEYA